MSHMYILDNAGEPIACDDPVAWGMWFEKNTTLRVIAFDVVGLVAVSTVFLGLDHSFLPGGIPILWESAIRYDDSSRPSGHRYEVERRYSSRKDALVGHHLLCETIRKGEL